MNIFEPHQFSFSFINIYIIHSITATFLTQLSCSFSPSYSFSLSPSNQKLISNNHITFFSQNHSTKSFLTQSHNFNTQPSIMLIHVLLMFVPFLAGLLLDIDKATIKSSTRPFISYLNDKFMAAMPRQIVYVEVPTRVEVPVTSRCRCSITATR